MFQCVGLATEKDGGCGEDWWHPECLVGLPRDWYKEHTSPSVKNPNDESSTEGQAPVEGWDDHPIPPGFPRENQFEALICYKCVDANPWIKSYAGSEDFLPLEFNHSNTADTKQPLAERKQNQDNIQSPQRSAPVEDSSHAMRKRKAENDEDTSIDQLKKVKVETDTEKAIDQPSSAAPLHEKLPPAPFGHFSLFARHENYRDHFCRCSDCYSTLRKYPQLLEEEETYEPPVSESGEHGDGAASAGTASLLDRGEAALSNVDRVRAIEGVMAYNHLKDKVKSFLQPFAESGQAVGAEDVKAYFEKLRGDAEAIRNAGGTAAANGGEDKEGDDSRREQSGKLPTTLLIGI
ncbi:putative E3 ubiquitin-protein ligase ubr7 [Bachmanniomyces sp. S44760]|nr:putative E3 ubiquitin-protein ligase ubr7 [Bachmanniomyces sp. S44760]